MPWNKIQRSVLLTRNTNERLMAKANTKILKARGEKVDKEEAKKWYWEKLAHMMTGALGKRAMMPNSFSQPKRLQRDS